MSLRQLRKSRFIRLWLIAVGLVAVLFIVVCDASPEHFGQAESSVDEPPMATPSPTESPSPVTMSSPTPATAVTPTPARATPTGTVPVVPSPVASIEAEAPPEPAYYSFEVVATYPHDPRAWTQGLEYVDGFLYEGTGLQGESTLRRVDLETGRVVQMIELDEELFGEGITLLDGRVYQLTLESNVAFVYDQETFDLTEEFTYPTQGWGLTNDGERFIMSDGSNLLYFRDSVTFEETGRVEVMDGDTPIRWLNELEYIEGEVFANIWHADWIARIDPETGRVNGWIDLDGLLRDEDRAGRRVDVLNGIAYDRDSGRLFVTGKLWPVLYEIELVPASSP
jgi:glutaminyl-peptide cyclotransferase